MFSSTAVSACILLLVLFISTSYAEKQSNDAAHQMNDLQQQGTNGLRTIFSNLFGNRSPQYVAPVAPAYFVPTQYPVLQPSTIAAYPVGPIPTMYGGYAQQGYTYPSSYPNMRNTLQYSAQNGGAVPNQYPSMAPGMSGPGGYLGSPAFGGNPGFGGNPSFAGNPSFPGNPGFGGNPGFASKPAFIGNPAFAGNPGFMGAQGFAGAFPGGPGFQGIQTSRIGSSTGFGNSPVSSRNHDKEE